MPPSLHTTTLRATLDWLAARIEPVAAPVARYEAETALESVLGLDRNSLYLQGDTPLSPAMTTAIVDIAARRLEGVPMPYVLGETVFHTVSLRVSPAVLIPRPDTEVLVTSVLETIDKQDALLVDMGTGSGCIAAALLAQRPAWLAVTTDISSEALNIASVNLADKPALCVRGDRLNCFALSSSSRSAAVDFVVSNPPYVTESDMRDLDPSVRDHEPAIALDGGPDGLDFYRYLARETARMLRSGNWLFVEVGATQAPAVCELLHTEGWHNVDTTDDLSGIARVVKAVRP